MDAAPAYSLENAVGFEWSSLTGDLHPERVAHLRSYLLGKTILDAGCGGGAFVEYLCANGFRVTGLDYHAIFLEVARARSGSQGVYVQGDITALPFADGEFDCAFCFDVLVHVEDRQALRELLRVSRQRVILAVPATDNNAVGHGLTFRHYQDLTHLRTYTRQSLEDLCREVGQSRFQILPELAVDVRGAAREHLESGSADSALKVAARRLFHGLLRRLLARARYRVIHSGWLVIIDLEHEAPDAPSKE